MGDRVFLPPTAYLPCSLRQGVTVRMCPQCMSDVLFCPFCHAYLDECWSGVEPRAKAPRRTEDEVRRACEPSFQVQLLVQRGMDDFSKDIQSFYICHINMQMAQTNYDSDA